MSRIRIGNQTSKTAQPLLLPFTYAMAKGFDAFEWFPDKDEEGVGWEESDLDAATRAWIRRRGRAHDIRFFIHAPLQTDAFREDAPRALRASLKLGEDIGAAGFVVHFPSAAAQAADPRALAPLIRHLDERGAQLALENVPSTTPEQVNRVFAILKKTETAQPAGFCLDLGHANLCPPTRNDFLAYLHGIAAWVPVVHIHAHENYGDSDSHLTLFTGAAGADDSGMRGFADWLRQRHFTGAIILEQWPSPPELLDQARQRLKAIL